MIPGPVLITGAGGQLGSDLQELIDDQEVRAVGHDQLDISDSSALEALMKELSPAVVFNCAAFHNLDVCEVEVDRSFEVNARAVKQMAQLCAQQDAKFVHVSTNYVFDGRAAEPYTENDLPSPRSIYAISKLAGEQTALAYAQNALVARTAGLYGLHGSASKGGNFVTRMLGRAKEQGELKMVADQRLNPTFTADLAASLIQAVERDVSGIVHLTAPDECTWFDFTEAIMQIAEIDVPIEAMQTTIPPGGVDRPLNGALASPVTTAAGIEPLRPWRKQLEDYMQRAGVAAGTTSG